jgi:hypothetical protein
MLVVRDGRSTCLVVQSCVSQGSEMVSQCKKEPNQVSIVYPLRLSAS